MLSCYVYLLDQHQEGRLIILLAIAQYINLGANMLDRIITAEISPGELIDKITILEIKMDRITEDTKLKNIKTEWDTLNQSRANKILISAQLEELTAELKAINETLWVIEDDIRECEHRKEFGEAFITLARSVYLNNDHRARVKRKINELLGSRLIEEKSYSDY